MWWAYALCYIGGVFSVVSMILVFAKMKQKEIEKRLKEIQKNFIEGGPKD